MSCLPDELVVVTGDGAALSCSATSAGSASNRPADGEATSACEAATGRGVLLGSAREGVTLADAISSKVADDGVFAFSLLCVPCVLASSSTSSSSSLSDSVSEMTCSGSTAFAFAGAACDSERREDRSG